MLGGTPADPRVIDRRRIDLWDRRTPLLAYHAAKSHQPKRAEGIVDRARKAASLMAERAVRALVNEMGTAGARVVAGGVILGTRGLPQIMPVSGMSHAGEHFAEGEMYRGVLLDALESCGLRPAGVREIDIEEKASSVLQLGDAMVRATELGHELGAPWTKDHKHAALMAWIALIGHGPHQRVSSSRNRSHMGTRSITS